jgi:hypothetical protein
MMRNDAGSTGCGAEAELAGYAAKGFAAAKMCVVGRDGARSSRAVARGHRRARSRGQSTKGRATWPARIAKTEDYQTSRRQRKRSRCYLHTSSAF